MGFAKVNLFLLFVVVVSGATPALAQRLCISTLSGESSKTDSVPISILKSDSALWLNSIIPMATNDVLDNISRNDGLPGAIVAALTRANPNYYYHWVRDAAIVIESLTIRFRKLSKVDPQDVKERQIILKRLLEYVSFSKLIQKLPTFGNDGEPKFEITGKPFNDEWGRPQDDSPAARAISMMKIIEIIQGAGDLDPHFVESIVKDLYDSKLPSTSLIKVDLEYIAHRWREPSFDLWEEVDGNHFYTLMVQRKALLDGASLARILNDPGAAEFYEAQAHEIEKSLANDFYDNNLKIFLATKPGSQHKGFIKNSYADIAVILGLLYGGREDGFLPFSSEKVIATLKYLENYFRDAFPINKVPGIPGVAIGRYVNDMFSGVDRSGGNPWVLATLAMAEAYYRLALEVKNNKGITVEGQFIDYLKLVEKGDEFIARVKYHAHKDGSTNEQIDRYTGFMTSVYKLTWNSAEMIRANFWREKVIGSISNNDLSQ